MLTYCKCFPPSALEIAHCDGPGVAPRVMAVRRSPAGQKVQEVAWGSRGQPTTIDRIVMYHGLTVCRVKIADRARIKYLFIVGYEYY